MQTLCSSCGKVKPKGHVCDGMKDTPRVNSNLFRYGNKLDGDFKEEGIEPFFARGLEREIDRLTKENEDHQFQNDCRSGSEICACSEKNGYPCYRHLDHEYRKLFTLNTATIDRAEQAEAERDRLREAICIYAVEGLDTNAIGEYDGDDECIDQFIKYSDSFKF